MWRCGGMRLNWVCKLLCRLTFSMSGSTSPYSNSGKSQGRPESCTCERTRFLWSLRDAPGWGTPILDRNKDKLMINKYLWCPKLPPLPAHRLFYAAYGMNQGPRGRLPRLKSCGNHLYLSRHVTSLSRSCSADHTGGNCRENSCNLL